MFSRDKDWRGASFSIYVKRGNKAMVLNDKAKGLIPGGPLISEAL